MSLQPLFPLEKQFQGKSGRNLTGGYLMVFLTGTDDPATTYSDYTGTLNPERIVLDDNGRAVVICDADLYYRLEVYDENGMLLWTEEPVACTGGGAAAAQVVTVESTDGSVDVTKTVVGTNTYFDLSTKVVMDETLDWIKASVSNISDGQVVPFFDEGTMYTTVDGIAVVAGRFYHTTTWLDIVPSGNGINYETVSVSMRLNGTALWTREVDIDNSVNDPVPLEVSYDFDCQADGYVDFEVTGVSSLSSVDLSTQFHRIFNGYSSEYAKKTWVSNSFVNNAYLNIQDGTITGISGTPIGGISEATVSSIASSYAESAASSKLDTSAFNDYSASALTGIRQDTATISSVVSSLETSKVDQSAFDACCSAVSAQVSSLSSDVSAIQQDTGAISAAVSGLTGTYIQYADLESASGKITGISGTALAGGHEYSGVWPIVVDNTADIISAANKPLCVDETMTGYESAGSAVIGVNTSTVLSGLSAYQLTADMSGYQPSGDYAYNSSLNDYQPVSGMTAYQPSGDYAYNSAVSSKAEQSSLTAYQEITGMSAYQLSGDYAYNSSLSDYQPVSGMSAYQLSGDYAYNSAVSGKQDASAMTAYQLSGDYAYNSSLADYQPTSAMTAYQLSGDYAYNSSLSDYQPVSGMSAYQPSGNYLVPDDITGKADVSSLTAYQEITGMSAYQLSGDYAYNSAVSSKMDASASSEFYPMTGNPSSFLVADDITGKADASALSDYQPVSAMTGYQPSGDYAYNSAVSSKAEESALTAYQEISGMTAYQLSGDYAYNSAVSGKQDSSAMTAYQEISGMTAYQPAGDYQPSGDYIYASSLGTGVI